MFGKLPALERCTSLLEGCFGWDLALDEICGSLHGGCWWAQQGGVVNEKMEREDGIYKKDLPSRFMLTLTFQNISSEII